VRWSDQAKADLKAIHDYIARDSTHYAKQVTRELVDKADGLAELPRLGRVVLELGDENGRPQPMLRSVRIQARCWGNSPKTLS
jgi:plasmid stabilization system protein ParE